MLMLVSAFFLYSGKLIGTFPLFIIVPFLLSFIYKDSITTIFIGSICILVTNFLMPDLGCEILLILTALVWLVLLSTAGKYLNVFLHINGFKKYLSIIGILLFILFSINSYFLLMGNPILYLKSKNILEKYINKYYQDKFYLDDFFSANIKTPCDYTYMVVDKKTNKKYAIIYDTSNKRINDDYYHEQIDLINHEIESDLLNTILSRTELENRNISTISVYTGENYNVDYTLKENYKCSDVQVLELYLEKDVNKFDNTEYLYSNCEQFSQASYEIIQALKYSKYNLKKIYINSTSAQGVFSAEINNINKINSLNDMKNIVRIEK